MDSIKESNLLNMNFASNTRQIRERYWVLSGKNSASSIQYLQYIDLHQNCCMHFWSHCIPRRTKTVWLSTLKFSWFFVQSTCIKFVGKRQIVWVKMSMTSLKFSWWTNKEKLFLFHSADILYTNQYHQVMLNVSIFAPILKNSNSCCSKNFELSN